MRCFKLFLFGLITYCTLNAPCHAEFGDVLWTLAPTGLNRETTSGASFGGILAVSGNLAVIAADEDGFKGEEAGAVWSFDLATGQPLHVLDPPNIAAGDGLAEGLAIDGELAVITTDDKNEDRGEAYVFNARTGEYLGAYLGSDSKADDEFGQAAGISGNVLLVTGENANDGAGAGYLFDLTTKQELRKLSANDATESQMGDGAVISGNHVLLAADNPHVYLFSASTGELRKKFILPGRTGDSVTIAASGSRGVVGVTEVEEQKGEVHLIDLDSLETRRVLKASDGATADEFGSVVATDGEVVLVGAASHDQGRGAVYVFDWLTGLQIAKLKSPANMAQEGFGDDGLAIAQGRAVIGAGNGGNGDLAAGLTYVFNVSFKDLADVNDDGQADTQDINLLHQAIRSSSSDLSFDVNHDGFVNATDRTVWVEALNHTFYGDANLDGQFNTSDFVQVFQRGEYEDALANNSGWDEGDWDGDGEFGSGDLVFAFQAGGFEAGARAAAPVPEPLGTLPALVIGLMTVGRFWRTRR